MGKNIQEKWICLWGIGYTVSEEYPKNFGEFHFNNETVILDKNGKSYEIYRFDNEFDEGEYFIHKDVLNHHMVVKGLESGLSMDVIRETFCQFVQLIKNEDFFDNKKVFKMKDVEVEKYLYHNPEFRLERRYEFAFKDEEMEQIYLGLIDGLSPEILKETYCKFAILNKEYEGPNTASFEDDRFNYLLNVKFSYNEPISLYKVDVMAFARECLNEGMDIDKVKFLLRVDFDQVNKPYTLLSLEQMKAVKECFNKGLTIENMEDFLAFNRDYIEVEEEIRIDECLYFELNKTYMSLRNYCICTIEEILEAIEMF